MTCKLKVMHVITGLARGGAEGALYRLCTTPGGDDVTVVSLLDEGIYGARLRGAGVDVHSLGLSSSPKSVFLAFLRLRKLMKMEMPDVVQTWMYHADLFGGVAAWTAKIPVCWGIRNSSPSEVGKWTTRLVAQACAAISGFIPRCAISCAKRAVPVHQAMGYVVPFSVIPNGFDLKAWIAVKSSHAVRQDFGLQFSNFVFAHAARAHTQKDHVTLAAAFSAAHEKNPSLRLLMCGTGLDYGSPYFEALPFSPRARKAVRALGARDDLPELWQLADGFVLSSVAEGFPNVVAEAMASGLPCVVTDVGDAGEIVGSTGIVVPPSDSAALARAMLELSAMSPNHLANLGTAARQRIADNFTLERMAEGFREVWMDVIRMGKR